MFIWLFFSFWLRVAFIVYQIASACEWLVCSLYFIFVSLFSWRDQYIHSSYQHRRVIYANKYICQYVLRLKVNKFFFLPWLCSVHFFLIAVLDVCILFCWSVNHGDDNGLHGRSSSIEQEICCCNENNHIVEILRNYFIRYCVYFWMCVRVLHWVFQLYTVYSVHDSLKARWAF